LTGIPQIARIHGSNITEDDSVVIIGAHQDSKNYKEPEKRSPGADDDGSGTVTILEAFRQLAEVGYAPAKTLEFHWYAAEEGGLRGSRPVAKHYRELGKNVAAMTQFDMTAWVKNGTDEAIGIVSSDVDIGLLALQVQIVNEYLDLPSVVYRFPPRAGSDQ
jgi:bacterial leucyl aminopeptidase